MRDVTDKINFFEGHNPRDLIAKFGTPLYVYNEKILRARCREMTTICSYPKFSVNYAVKANTNLSLLRIVRNCGCHADVSSVGEAVAAMAAGFLPHEMFFIVNNVSENELLFAVDKRIIVSVDSLSQISTLGKINEGGKIALRFNSGV
ncbi:MAG: diaminopimelate decarboxylase, partial [Defluviitaleaceae bacterium]|nr:diaminopimelate decarboxylase [Defluviitaleaceae bacterium]